MKKKKSKEKEEEDKKEEEVKGGEGRGGGGGGGGVERPTLTPRHNVLPSCSGIQRAANENGVRKVIVPRFVLPPLGHYNSAIACCSRLQIRWRQNIRFGRPFRHRPAERLAFVSSQMDAKHVARTAQMSVPFYLAPLLDARFSLTCISFLSLLLLLLLFLGLVLVTLTFPIQYYSANSANNAGMHNNHYIPQSTQPLPSVCVHMPIRDTGSPSGIIACVGCEIVYIQMTSRRMHAPNACTTGLIVRLQVCVATYPHTHIHTHTEGEDQQVLQPLSASAGRQGERSPVRTTRTLLSAEWADCRLPHQLSTIHDPRSTSHEIQNEDVNPSPAIHYS
ncbi:unnamed protein product [Protopolystoma xenopodis]|uniref:Uncharacterized protein n=1 Tax=Protopolystoma xenopodis TaxID=117903 RepID=A0A3S5CSY6_9PLAT|nr:unnamed protein product [Protopolystoma xenopodis]